MPKSKPPLYDMEPVDDPAEPPVRFPWRACLISLVLIPLLVFWVEYTEIVSRGSDLAAMSLPMASTFALLVLIILNVAVSKIAPRSILTQAELILIYCMTTIAVYIGGIGMVQFLNAELVGWSYFATPDNRWDQWFPLLKKWALPDVSVVKDYYTGGSTLFANGHLEGWARAICVWTMFLVVLTFSLYCIAALVRKQWVENERLMFPIVHIPMEITRDGGLTGLWRSHIFWLGFVVPVVVETMATLHTLLPPVPYVPIKPEAGLEIGHYLTIHPWNAVGYLTLSFYPLVIGVDLPAFARRLIFMLVLLPCHQSRGGVLCECGAARFRPECRPAALCDRAGIRRVYRPGDLFHLAWPHAF